MATRPIPDGYRTVTPYQSVDDAAGAIEYYTEEMAERAKAAMAAMSG